MHFSLILFNIWILSSNLSNLPAFPGILSTLDKTPLIFNIQFAESRMLISEKLLKCVEEINCKFLSQEIHYDYFNKTSYSYKDISVDLRTTDDQIVRFKARLTTLEINILGMLSTAEWKVYLPSGSLKIDFVTGEVYFLVLRPTNLKELKISAINKEFYMNAKLCEEIETQNNKIGNSVSKVDLYFPAMVNSWNSEFFIMMSLNELTGWSDFLFQSFNSGHSDTIKCAVVLSEDIQINFGSEIFYSYDRQPFKKSDMSLPSSAFLQIGRFFVLKSQMKLVVTVEGPEKNIKAGVEIVDGYVTYFYWFEIKTVLYYLSWVILIRVGLSVGLLFLPASLKFWSPTWNMDKINIE